MAVNKSDFDKICRMCLLSKINMFSIYNEETIIAIKNCIDIEVKENDDFPKSICFDCLQKVYTYATFRELCKNSEKILNEIVKKDFITADNNYKDDYSSYCKQENVTLTTDVENIKKEVVIKEELDLDDKDDKSHLLPENTIDYDHKEEESDKTNSAQDEESPVKEVEPKKTIPKQTRKCVSVKKHKCDKCSKTYGDRSGLAKHLIRAHKATADIKCDECGKMFLIQAQLDGHKRVHHKRKTCDICGKEVNRLERHKKSHDRSKKYFCLKCDASFYQESYLETHVKRFHSGTQSTPKKCPLCNKSVFDLKVHTLQVHSQKRHKCDQCEEAFAFRSILLEHVKKKHLGIRDERKALCPTCGKAFPSNGKLKQHLRTHTEERQFDCHLCDKRYKTNAGLHFHLKVHAGIRPFICTHCGKGFHTKVILENHLRTHTGERPFACFICGHTFTQKVSLRTHMKSHGGGHTEDSLLAYT